VSSLRYLAATLVLYTALTAVMTYPQYLHPAAVHDDGDPLLNAWAIAWVAHQLPIAPAHLFDGNVFYPERRTLAYSETLLVPSAIVAPLLWAGVGTLVVYNIVFLSGFIVSGAGTALLVRSLTGSAAAGVIGGIVFAFLPYRIDHYPHVQLQQTQCLPFALWAFHRLLKSDRLRDGVLFGLFFAGQLLSCMYYALFLVPYLAVVCGILAVADGRLSRRRIVALAAASAIVIVAAIPVGRVYLGARKVVGERTSEEVANGSARIRNYLGPPEANLLYGELLKRFADGERRLFPGFVAMALAIVALWPRRGARRRQPSEPQSDATWPARLAYAVGLLLAFDLSLGFNGITYRLLYDNLLPFRGLRIPARMGIITGFSLAVLAGFGVARLIRWRRQALCSKHGYSKHPCSKHKYAGMAIAGVIGIAMLAEYASKPLDVRQIPSPPESYADILRDRGDGPTTAIFEYPASPLDDPTYMYYSTFHWQHLVNGYSGFFPPSYNQVVRAMRNFPDQASIDAMKSHGARYLVVHGERLFGARYEELIPQIERRRDFVLVSRRPSIGPDGHKEVSVYRISYSEP
jgi:hypothetical protein